MIGLLHARTVSPSIIIQVAGYVHLVGLLVGEEMDIAEGDTAPEVICKAFLTTREEGN